MTLDQETVWLTRSQMEELFLSTRQNITTHIRNILDEGGLDTTATVKEAFHEQDVLAAKTAFRNLDLVAVRVNLLPAKSPRQRDYKLASCHF